MLINILTAITIWFAISVFLGIIFATRDSAPWMVELRASRSRYLHGTTSEKGSQPPPEK